MENLTARDKKVIADYLEQEVLSYKTTIREQADDNMNCDCAAVVDVSIIEELIKKLKCCRFSDIKFNVGTKFKFGGLVFVVCQHKETDSYYYMCVKTHTLYSSFLCVDSGFVEVVQDADS